MGEGKFAEFVILELPEIYKPLAHGETHWPIVVFAIDWIGERLTLGVALNAGVGCLHIVELGGVNDMRGSRMRRVITAGPVTALASDVPLRHCLGVDIVVNRVTAIA
jgi:hypothetical protein